MARARKGQMNFGAAAKNAVFTGAGGVATRLITRSVLPATLPSWLANLGPLAVGVILPEIVKNDTVKSIGDGMVAVAIADTASSLSPEKVGNLSDEYHIQGLANEYNIEGTSEMAEYEDIIKVGNADDARNSLGNPNDGKNALAGMPSPWYTNPADAAQDGLMGDLDHNSYVAG